MAATMNSVLIIEDSLDILMLAQMCLESEGWTVYAAETGALGLAAAEARRPDIILLDSRLPDLEGWEVLRKLRAAPVIGKIPVVLFSASKDPHYQETEMELQGKIPKPFNALTLGLELRAFLPNSD